MQSRIILTGINRYARSPQWYHERPNEAISSFRKFCYNYIPMVQRVHRLQIFLASDRLVTTYVPGEKAACKREETEQQAKNYIYSRTPEKYHSIIVPEFPLGKFVPRGSRPILTVNIQDAREESSIQTTLIPYTNRMWSSSNKEFRRLMRLGSLGPMENIRSLTLLSSQLGSKFPSS